MLRISRAVTRVRTSKSIGAITALGARHARPRPHEAEPALVRQTEWLSLLRSAPAADSLSAKARQALSIRLVLTRQLTALSAIARMDLKVPA